MKRIFGRGDRLDEPLDGRNVSPGRKRLLLAFHLSALATIVLPWIFFGMMRSMRGEAASGDDENQQNNWWNNGDDNADNGEGDQDQDQQQDEAEENNDENQDEQDDGQDQEDDGDQDENDNNNNERRLGWWWNRDNYDEEAEYERDQAHDGDQDENDNNNNNNNNNNERRLGWWWNRDNYDEEAEYERDQAQRLIVLTFIYVWSFLVFIILLCYASVALTRQGMAVSLFTALVMFANLALMCCVLVETSGLLWRDDEEARERYGEEGGWWGTLAGGLVGPTFFLWFLWSTVMAMMVYCIVMKRRRNSSNDKVSKIGSRDEAPGTDDKTILAFSVELADVCDLYTVCHSNRIQSYVAGWRCLGEARYPHGTG
eukprot:CAMPEP_0194065948 /NCGR_PEP_ID=MMETSP0009_2-20130614/85749_1 /TAXON_ID=210454 /ORGANISM="Grammatophora oceanica, Strain CCMP 410" /LENGTH=370 /DNA_ID=CAMNT_0038718849 /DNA_START=54 /DNA_END=1167 /DNA_ORIENTATION=+